MAILISTFLVLFLLILIGKKIIYSAKRNLFKDQASWSGKDIKIKHNEVVQNFDSTSNSNYLKLIAEESKMYLDKQEKKDV